MIKVTVGRKIESETGHSIDSSLVWPYVYRDHLRTIRDGEPRTVTATLTQFLNFHSIDLQSVLMNELIKSVKVVRVASSKERLEFSAKNSELTSLSIS